MGGEAKVSTPKAKPVAEPNIETTEDLFNPWSNKIKIPAHDVEQTTKSKIEKTEDLFRW